MLWSGFVSWVGVSRRVNLIAPFPPGTELSKKNCHSRSSLNGHCRKRTALFTAALFETRFNSHTNSVFLHSRKRTPRKRPRTLSEITT